MPHTRSNSKSYNHITPAMALGLAAPHTWPASVLPCFLAYCTAMSSHISPDILVVLAVTVIAVLMQASVNTFNDYFDYVKGADSASDNVTPDDAVLVYNNVNPKHALALAIAFLACAFLIGIYVIVKVGFVPLVFAIVGAIFVVSYSGGKTPLSYLPVGEIVSGVVMGGLIYLAASYCFVGTFDLRGLLVCLPLIIGIGLIMMTNNTCDIEKDIESHRNTLPVKLGREKARQLYHLLLAAMILLILLVCLIFYRNALVILFPCLLLSMPFLIALWKNPLAQPTRVQAMTQILSVNVVIGLSYGVAILASGLL